MPNASAQALKGHNTDGQQISRVCLCQIRTLPQFTVTVTAWRSCLDMPADKKNWKEGVPTQGADARVASYAQKLLQ